MMSLWEVTQFLPTQVPNQECDGIIPVPLLYLYPQLKKTSALHR